MKYGQDGVGIIRYGFGLMWDRVGMSSGKCWMGQDYAGWDRKIEGWGREDSGWVWMMRGGVGIIVNESGLGREDAS